MDFHGCRTEMLHANRYELMVEEVHQMEIQEVCRYLFNFRKNQKRFDRYTLSRLWERNKIIVFFSDQLPTKAAGFITSVN